MQLSSQMFSEALTALRLADLNQSDNDRRRYSRFVIQAKLLIWPISSEKDKPGKQNKPSSVLSRDVSMDGIGLLWPHPPTEGEQFVLALPRDKKTHALVLCAIKYIRPLAEDIWGIGAQYSKILEQLPQAVASHS